VALLGLVSFLISVSLLFFLILGVMVQGLIVMTLFWKIFLAICLVVLVGLTFTLMLSGIEGVVKVVKRAFYIAQFAR
jgi:hypothetical protein